MTFDLSGAAPVYRPFRRPMSIKLLSVTVFQVIKAHSELEHGSYLNHKCHYGSLLSIMNPSSEISQTCGPDVFDVIRSAITAFNCKGYLAAASLCVMNS